MMAARSMPATLTAQGWRASREGSMRCQQRPSRRPPGAPRLDGERAPVHASPESILWVTGHYMHTGLPHTHGERDVAKENKGCGSAGTVHGGLRAPHRSAVPRISYSGARGALVETGPTHRRCNGGLLFRGGAGVSCQGSLCFSARRIFGRVPPLSAPPSASQQGARLLQPWVLIAVASGLAEHVHGHRHDMHQFCVSVLQGEAEQRRSCAVVLVCIDCDRTLGRPFTRARVVARHCDR